MMRAVLVGRQGQGILHRVASYSTRFGSRPSCLQMIADEIGAEIATAVGRNRRLTAAIAGDDVAALAAALDDLDPRRPSACRISCRPFISSRP